MQILRNWIQQEITELQNTRFPRMIPDAKIYTARIFLDEKELENFDTSIFKELPNVNYRYFLLDNEPSKLDLGDISRWKFDHIDFYSMRETPEELVKSTSTKKTAIAVIERFCGDFSNITYNWNPPF